MDFLFEDEALSKERVFIYYDVVPYYFEVQERTEHHTTFRMLNTRIVDTFEDEGVHIVKAGSYLGTAVFQWSNDSEFISQLRTDGNPVLIRMDSEIYETTQNKYICPVCGGNIILSKTLMSDTEVHLEVDETGKPVKAPEVEMLENCYVEENEHGAYCSKCEWSYNLYEKGELATNKKTLLSLLMILSFSEKVNGTICPIYAKK